MNENSNGLVRQYFSKEMELVDFSDEQVQWSVDKLNHRLGKVLGYRTLHKVLFGGEIVLHQTASSYCPSILNPQFINHFLFWALT